MTPTFALMLLLLFLKALVLAFSSLLAVLNLRRLCMILTHFRESLLCLCASSVLSPSTGSFSLATLGIISERRPVLSWYTSTEYQSVPSGENESVNRFVTRFRTKYHAGYLQGCMSSSLKETNPELSIKVDRDGSR